MRLQNFCSKFQRNLYSDCVYPLQIWLTTGQNALTCQNQRFGMVQTEGLATTPQILGHCYTPNTKLESVELNKEMTT